MILQTQEFPDGGWQAWSVVLGSWCGMVSSFGLLNSVGVLQAWLANKPTEGLFGFLHRVDFWCFQFLSLCYGHTNWSVPIHFNHGDHSIDCSGPIFDAHGLKYILIPECIGLVLSLMMFSFCKEYYQVMLGFSLLGGATASMIITPSIACVTHWFFRRRGLALGLATTAGGFGGIIFPIIITNLLDSVGFPWAIHIVGFVSGVFCLACVLLLKTRLPPKKAGARVDLKALREIPFTTLSVAIILVDFALLVPLTYIPSYAIAHGMDSSLAYQLASILNSASILGRALPGYSADRYGRLNVMALTTLFCAIFTLGLWLPIQSNIPGIVAYTVLFGFWSGSAISLTLVCVAQVSRTEDYGKRYGTTYSLVSIGALAAVPIAGAILRAQNGNYQGIILFVGLAYVLAFVLFVLARGMCTGWRLKRAF